MPTTIIPRRFGKLGGGWGTHQPFHIPALFGSIGHRRQGEETVANMLRSMCRKKKHHKIHPLYQVPGEKRTTNAAANNPSHPHPMYPQAVTLKYPQDCRPQAHPAPLFSFT